MSVYKQINYNVSVPGPLMFLDSQILRVLDRGDETALFWTVAHLQVILLRERES